MRDLDLRGKRAAPTGYGYGTPRSSAAAHDSFHYFLLLTPAAFVKSHAGESGRYQIQEEIRNLITGAPVICLTTNYRPSELLRRYRGI